MTRNEIDRHLQAVALLTPSIAIQYVNVLDCLSVLAIRFDSIEAAAYQTPQASYASKRIDQLLAAARQLWEHAAWAASVASAP